MEPSANGQNDRASSGQFAAGNPGGPGNPHAAKVGKLRSALLAVVTADDVQAIVEKLVELAKSGNLAAAKLLIDRAVGKFADQVVLRKKLVPRTPPLAADSLPSGDLKTKQLAILARIERLRESMQ